MPGYHLSDQEDNAVVLHWDKSIVAEGVSSVPVESAGREMWKMKNRTRETKNGDNKQKVRTKGKKTMS